MFRTAQKPVQRAVPQTDNIHPRGIPYKGLNTMSPFGAMDENDAIALNNVIVESFGLRTRKGYTNWATGLPSEEPVNSILNYYPSIYDPKSQTFGSDPGRYLDIISHMMVSPRSTIGPGPGTIFAAQDEFIYDVTLGGTGPWVPEVGVTGPSSFWNGCNYQNVAGSFLLIANEEGGYAIYNGVSWSMPVEGIGPTEINGVDPATIVWVTAWKERVWFFVKGSTVAYYLPPGQITGTVTAFDFGTAMDHGGALSFLGGWTIDGGIGTDDHLVAIGSQGDVVIYKGTDPDDISSFALHGVWYAGPLPVGLRCVEGGGGDIMILTQFGVMPLSGLMKPTNLGSQFHGHLTKNIDPLVASLMRDYSTLPGWQIFSIAKEELILIRIPTGATLATSIIANSFICYKTTTQAWSVLSALPFAHTVTAGSLAYAGSLNGRVLRAFDGNLDNVGLESEELGYGIKCRVTPAYSALGSPSKNKIIKMIRPMFVSASIPKLTVTVLSNYMPPKAVFTPTFPGSAFGSTWDNALWNVGIWGGALRSLHEWFGCKGWGHAVTVQLDYTTGGDTILMGVDYWGSEGGVM